MDDDGRQGGRSAHLESFVLLVIDLFHRLLVLLLVPLAVKVNLLQIPRPLPSRLQQLLQPHFDLLALERLEASQLLLALQLLGFLALLGCFARAGTRRHNGGWFTDRGAADCSRVGDKVGGAAGDRVASDISFLVFKQTGRRNNSLLFEPEVVAMLKLFGLVVNLVVVRIAQLRVQHVALLVAHFVVVIEQFRLCFALLARFGLGSAALVTADNLLVRRDVVRFVFAVDPASVEDVAVASAAG
jgi:hypothetical protein